MAPHPFDRYAPFTRKSKDLKYRHSPRKKLRDYTRSGEYFVTICAKGRERLFGNVSAGKMMLNKLGKIVEDCWRKIPEHYSCVRLGAYIVMPNHVHGLIEIVHDGRDMACHVPTYGLHRCSVACHAPSQRKFGKPLSGSLSAVVGSFKSATTREVNILRNESGAVLWQSRFHDHIVRDIHERATIKRYILQNPFKWADYVDGLEDPDTLFIE